ncbi:hypothetical protein LAZ67_18002691 [Cordylochernes scorpioides]|uniref:Reverse transcriptase domain-containing protein n=1 Tax=Cordylochernes scorpioides TaxID=51811 RepID=A0ABY6LH16_9ARAC|nr:hypothetical protein LAZ67_18002691 [Cordylochernes scorpioides]
MGHYPTIWTKSIIHPIFKSGDKDNPSNYRGIALISNFSKLFTTILRSRLNEWVERRNVIPENQAGFRRGRSCVDLIFTLTSLIQLSLRKKRGKLYVFFVDLRKAFDTVPHSLLWKKLTNLGVSYQFIHAIRNYYEQATVAVRWRGSITENIKIHSGVLQGEPLSPLLFILFMTDLIKMYDNSDLTSVYLPEFGDVHLLMYADDIAIIGESRVNLQKKINLLKEYLGVNEMTLNESKSKIMVFRNGGKPSREDRWYWNGKPLMVTGRYIYLGYPLVSTTKTTQVANFFKGKALAAINATTPLLAKSKINSLNSAMKLFDSIVMAVLMYAAPIWATEYKDLLDHIQDTFIRRFLNLPRYTPGYIIRPETGRVSLIIIALKLTLKYWLRVLSMDTNRLPRICLTRMRQLSCATGAPIGFIKQLSNLLNNNGSSWLTYCNDPDSLRNAIPGILRTAIEQTIQNDLTRITQSKLYSHYRDIYTAFTTEEYFLTELPFPIIRLISQFRTLSIFFREHHLILLRREDLKCTFCGSGITTEMLHYLFDCAALSEERRKLNDKTGQLCPSFPALIDEISKNRTMNARPGNLYLHGKNRYLRAILSNPKSSIRTHHILCKYRPPVLSLCKYHPPELSLCKSRPPELSLCKYHPPVLSLCKYRPPMLSLCKYRLPELSLCKYHLPELSLCKYHPPVLILCKYRPPELSLCKYHPPVLSLCKYRPPVLSLCKSRPPELSLCKSRPPELSLCKYHPPVLSLCKYCPPVHSLCKYRLPELSLCKYHLPELSLCKYHPPVLILCKYRPSLSLCKYCPPVLSLCKYRPPVVSLCKYRPTVLSLCKYHPPVLSLCKYRPPMLSLCKYHLPVLSLCKYHPPELSLCKYRLPPSSAYVNIALPYSAYVNIALPCSAYVNITLPCSAYVNISLPCLAYCSAYVNIVLPCSAYVNITFPCSACTRLFGGTYTKIGAIQRRLAWPLHKDDTQNREARAQLM